MRKFFKTIHLWLSVPFGLIIMLICLSGALLVFETEVTEGLYHDLYYVQKVAGEPLPIDRLLENVSGNLPDSVSITGVTISSEPERAYQVNLSKPRRASIYIDQYTGEVKGRNERSPFFTKMFLLHRFLLDSMKPDGGIFLGKLIVGISTLMFVFVLISGIIIWLPRTFKALKNSLKITVGKGKRRFWYDLHVAGGMYALLFLLVLALTGLTWSFSWYQTGFYKVFGAEVQQEGGYGHAHGGQASAGRGHGKDKASGHGGYHGKGNDEKGDDERGGHFTPYRCWQQVYEQLAARNPLYKQITLSDASASVSFDRLGNRRASDNYTFNPHNGEITNVKLYKDTDRADKLRGWIFSLHTGSWGGLFTRILTFIAALLGASLPLTGYYLWIRRLKRKTSSDQAPIRV